MHKQSRRNANSLSEFYCSGGCCCCSCSPAGFCWNVFVVTKDDGFKRGARCNVCGRSGGKLAHRSISAEKSQYLSECWSGVRVVAMKSK